MRFVFETSLNGKTSGEPTLHEFDSQEMACGAAVSCLQLLANASLQKDRNTIYEIRVLSEAGILLCSASLTMGPQAKNASGDCKGDTRGS